ncbi:c-type cytochrome [Altererythrobacter lauratis]|uniref:C-type cytochrome n=1 Tax=Alteraurantiacibacter lauratis TaxID=2054627 RepID=A0ABV7EJI3_9SPHN
MRRDIALLGAVSTGLAACQPLPTAQGSAAPPHRDVLAFAQAACGGCHAVEADAISPVAEAPEWPRIVNTAGLTRDSLRTWLVDAHNYPEEMDFTLDPPQVDDLVDYMLTLQRADYRPPSL